jgi:hypothetical protein
VWLPVWSDRGQRAGAAAGDEIGDLAIGHDDLRALVISHGDSLAGRSR